MFLFVIFAFSTSINCQSNSTYQKIQLIPEKHSQAYYIQMFLGNPPQKQLMVVDTGSGLMNINCAECQNCESTIYPKYETNKSSTANSIFCTTLFYDCLNRCQTLQECSYSIGYFNNQTVSTGVIRRDLAAFGPNPSQDSQFEVQFLCTSFIKTEPGLQENYNGIFGFSTSFQNSIRNWFIKQRINSPKKISFCLGRHQGYLQLGSSSKTEDQVNETVIISQIIPLSGPLRTRQVTEMKLGELNLYDKSIDTIGIVVDSGASVTCIAPKKYEQVVQMTDKICQANSKYCNRFEIKGKTRRCYLIEYPPFVMSQQEFLNKIFPNFEVTLNATKISTNASHYFTKFQTIRGVTLYCLGFRETYEIEGEPHLILGINWLYNKKLTINYDEEYMQIRPNFNCDRQQSQVSDIYQSQATSYAALSYLILLLVFVLIVSLPTLPVIYTSLKAKLSGNKPPYLVEQHAYKEAFA